MSATVGYYRANIATAARLRARFNPAAKLYLSVWWHYMCAQSAVADPQSFVRDGNLDALFSVAGEIDGIALWGSVGDFGGEDANATEVTRYVDAVWGPRIAEHCRPVDAQHVGAL